MKVVKNVCKYYRNLVDRIREGKTTDADINLLNTRYTPNESVYDRYITLFPTKAEAERVNRTRISEIESKEFLYKAKTILDISPNKNKSLENIFPIIDELRLRLGASVMMVPMTQSSLNATFPSASFPVTVIVAKSAM